MTPSPDPHLSLSAALALARLGAYEWDLSTGHVMLDERSRAILGFSADEPVDAGLVFSRIHPDDLSRVQAVIESAIGELRRAELAYRVRHPDGTVLALVSIGHPHVGEDGTAARVSGFFFDATEQISAREARRESEERLSFALNAGGGVGAWDWDVVNDRVYMEAPFAQIFSVDPARAAKGVPLGELAAAMHPEDRDRVKVLIEHAMRTGEDYSAEYRVGPRGGTVRWVYARGRCHLDAQGQPVRFPGVVFDITERKNLEMRLAERERRYHALFNSIDQGYCLCEMIWHADGKPADYRFLELNPKFVEATGLSRELAMSGTARDIVPGLENFWVERYGAVVTNGEPDRFESHSPAMGRWFDVFAQPVGDSRFALIFNDITAKKLAEAEREQLDATLCEERMRLDQVFSQAPVAIALFRGPEFVMELANPLFQQLVQGRELVGRRLYDAVPELGPEIRNALTGVLETGEPFIASEWPVPYDFDRDGIVEDHWFSLVYSPLREPGGRISGVVAVLAEVTGQVVARRELERVNRDLEEFAYVASHDLQEPLRMVGIYSELLAERYGGGDANSTLYAKYIRQGVTRMGSLISDLLAYSRTIQKEEHPVGEADLNAALADAVSVLADRIAEAQASIDAAPLPTVKGDPGPLAHVFQNLLSNALKYRRKSVPPQIRISVQRSEEQAVVAVEDNGIGFEAAYAERIFGLFKRLHKDEYPGTGLGLAICQRTVERYGGRIWAEGRPGEGSTFYFSLPLAQK